MKFTRQTKLDHCPDAVVLDAASGEVLVGMYELVDGERRGGLVSLNPRDFQAQRTLLSDVGVLDINQAHNSTLLACSDGKIRCFREASFSEISVSGETGMKSVAMAVTGRFSSPLAASITTAGELQLSDVASSSSVWRMQAHSKEWESWFVASDGQSLVATASDDCTFRLFDTATTAQVFSSRFHQTGVTWLDFETERPHSLITGSYDERMCFWDLRNLSAGPVQTWNLEGGVWRTKRVEDERYLVAMCYGGFGVYEAGKKLHGSEDLGLCYGVDLIQDAEIVALDFYEKTVSAYSVLQGL